MGLPIKRLKAGGLHTAYLREQRAFDDDTGTPNNLLMPVILESQIGLLERGAPSPDAREVEDLIAFYMTALERLESRLNPGGISEADRPLVPLFQRWLSAARQVKEIVRTLRNEGRVVGGYDDLLRAMNRSKPVAERFDHFVALNKQLSTEQSAAGGV